jgi:hypothetical protein
MLCVVGLVSLLTRPRLGIPYKHFGNNFIDLVKKDLFIYILVWKTGY